MPERLTIGTKKAFEKNYPFPYEKNGSVRRQFMFALRAASGLVAMKFWCCVARTGLGLPLMVPSMPTG